jgi:hypothetical protein
MARTPFLLALALVAFSVPARADPPVRVASTAAAPNTTQPATAIAATAPAGLVVVALPGATDAAWPLARDLYASPTVRPAGIDEAHARVLCGDSPAADAPAEMRDLAADVAALHGDDAPSRALLADVARRMAVRGVVVVFPGQPPSARVFIAETGAIDAATYAPDAAPATAWSAAVASLTRAYGVATAVPAAPPASPVSALPRIATHDGPTIENEPPHHRRFYESGWFWGAVGAALFAGGAVYFATRDNGPETIHLQLQVPH